MEIINSILLILAAAAVAFAFVYEKRPCGEVQKERIRHERLIVLLVLLFALAIRLWRFTLVPGGVNQDGAMAGVDAKALADYASDRFGMHLPAHLTAWGFGQMSAMLSYLIAPLVRLMGLNMLSLRLPTLLLSMLGMLCFYLFMSKGFGRRAGLITLCLTAISPWHFMQSRWALDCNLFPHFFVIALYLLQTGLERRQGLMYLSMLVFALSMYCYGVSIYTVPLFLSCCCVWLIIKKRISIKAALLCLLCYIIPAMPFLLTMAVNFFKWSSIELPFVTIPFFSGSTRAADILFFSSDPMHSFVSNIKSFLNLLISQDDTLLWNCMRHFGAVYLFSLPFALPAVAYLFRNKGKNDKGNNSAALLAVLFMTGVWNCLITNNVNINRANLIFYPLIALIALGIYRVTELLRPIRIPVLASYALATVMMLSTYFGSYAEQIGHSFYYGFGDALKLMQESGAEKLYISADVQYSGSYQTAEIITLFYSEADSAYFRGEKQEEGLLPYSERYNYTHIDSELLQRTEHENAAYLARQQERELFNTEEFELNEYGDYIAAVRK